MSKVRDVLLDEMKAGGWPVTFSIGVVTCHEPPGATEDVVKMADGLMYEIKTNTKNAISYASFRDGSLAHLPQTL